METCESIMIKMLADGATRFNMHIFYDKYDGRNALDLDWYGPRELPELWRKLKERHSKKS